jgi:hypothetical protein
MDHSLISLVITKKGNKTKGKEEGKEWGSFTKLFLDHLQLII